jgi:putative endonuclease
MGNRSAFVYIIGNDHGTIYVGFTNDLRLRISQHKSRRFPGFAAKYGLTRLLYFEAFERAEEALEAEHMIKGWRGKRS